MFKGHFTRVYLNRNVIFHFDWPVVALHENSSTSFPRLFLGNEAGGLERVNSKANKY